MEPHDYVVADIRGDYAYLQRTDAPEEPLFQVALALLPPETDLHTKLRGMMGFFEIIE